VGLAKSVCRLDISPLAIDRILDSEGLIPPVSISKKNGLRDDFRIYRLPWFVAVEE